MAKYATKPSVGVWAGDAVGHALLKGMSVSTVVIEHDDLQTLPLGCVMSDEERYHNHHCSGHYLRDKLDDDDAYMHRCSLEYVCALTALVRKETHYRSPTILEDLLYQKNLWQYRVERLLDLMMCCTECQAEMSHAFNRGEGLTYYTDCDTSPCCFVRRMFDYGTVDPMPPRWNPSLYQDSTLDTLCVLTPVTED